MPSATFDFATVYMWMAASCVFFGALRMSLERWVLPLVWDWIKCKESDRLPPEGYGAGTLQDISVRCTSVFFSTMIVANSYSVLMNPQMQHFAARGLLPGMTGEADWTAGCSWEATHCDAHFWSASVVGGYMLYGAPSGQLIWQAWRIGFAWQAYQIDHTLHRKPVVEGGIAVAAGAARQLDDGARSSAPGIQ